MFSICIHGYASARTLNLWSFVLSQWPPAKVYLMRPLTGLVTNERKFVDAVLVRTAADLPKDQPLVLLSPSAAKYIPGTDPITDFEHPENPVYMFGSNRGHLGEDDMGSRTPDHSVYIPGGCSDMYDFMAGSVVLYDREMKRGRHDHR